MGSSYLIVLPEEVGSRPEMQSMAMGWGCSVRTDSWTWTRADGNKADRVSRVVSACKLQIMLQGMVCETGARLQRLMFQAPARVRVFSSWLVHTRSKK